ncbi:MAG TPA: hypothetical protein VNG13_08030 [Mycobacteriales bacterium]|nr:hypothetical protein [Mycobacteriales bacterium]
MISNTGSLVAAGIAVAALLPLLFGLIFVILIVANRAEPDPSGRRPTLVYLFATSFVTLFAGLFASVAFVAGLCQLIGATPGQGPGSHPVGDAVARQSVLSLLVLAVAGGLYLVHQRAGARASAEDLVPLGPLGRVRRSYGSAVIFLCVLIVAVTAVIAVYQLFRIAGPGVFHGGNRVASLRGLIPTAYFAVAAAALARWHLRDVPAEVRPQFGRPRPLPSPPAPVDITPEVDVVATPARTRRAPRKPPAR